VVNFDLPNVAEDYVHRIGRTGRAGASGHSYSLVSADEADYLYGIERLIRTRLPQEVVEGFEPDENLPARKERGPRRDGAPGRRRGGGRASGSGQRQRSGAANGNGNGNGNGSRRRRRA
jgi:ATP-dependent RNA helicase RhlE